jgi:uncharacterized protein involved in response to NO
MSFIARAISVRAAPPAVFGYGFRPFFLLSAIAAVAVVPVWLGVLMGAGWPADAPPRLTWHAHEMLFAFAGAAIAGFMLTAIPNWTGAAPVTGWPLSLLAVLWVAGRFALCPVSGVPSAWAAAVDLAFFPALGAAVAVPLIRAGKWRNTAFLALLALLWTGNLLFHLDWLRLLAGAAQVGTRLVVDVILVMVAVVGGRIIPTFTQNAVKRRDPRFALAPAGQLDLLAVGLTVLMLVVDLVAPNTTAAGAVATAAAAAHAARLAGWRGERALLQPILWILHLGYGWLVVGLALKAAWLLTGAPFAAAWLHAITAGCFATMIVAVASRASLGHTGRPIVAAPTTVAAYVALSAAAVIRVAAPLFGSQVALTVAGVLWTSAFVLFLVSYAPVLLQPRADGRPG